MNDDVDEAGLQKNRTKQIAIGIGIAAILGAAIGGSFLFSQKAPKGLTPEEVVRSKANVGMLARDERLRVWREWAVGQTAAGTPIDASLRAEAFAQLAWEKDKEGMSQVIEGLKDRDHNVRGRAAQAVAEYGSTADSAKPLLLEALMTAEANDKPMICWALAVLKEQSAFDVCFAEYRAGHLANIQRLDGSPAFDADVFTQMTTLDTLAKHAGDESVGVRQLVAVALAQTGDPKWTTALTTLVQDKTIEVSREAAVGLGKIANEAALQPLLNALQKADNDSREKFLEALRDGVGGKGLVLALKMVPKDSPNAKGQSRQLFRMLAELNDPRGGDALVEYIQSGPPAAYKTQAALRLAEIGDLRAAPTLGWRLAQETLKLYDPKDWPNEHLEGKAKDAERVAGARHLADLALLYPDKVDQIRKDAEEGALTWSDPTKPGGWAFPHANAMRFLTAAKSTAVLPKLRQWADPTLTLPKEGELNMHPTWGAAQSALRYLGVTKDPGAWALLEKQIKRRPQKVDASMEALSGGGYTALGMTVSSLGVGAADGFAEYGDPKAYPILIKHAEDAMENEQSRLASCSALAWTATDAQIKDIIKKIKDLTKGDKASNFLRTCYLETIVRRPAPEASTALFEILTSSQDVEVRHQVARALGRGGLPAALVPQLFTKLKDANVKSDAALALMLGADADTATRTLATFNDGKPEQLDELKDVFNRTFAYWSDRSYESGAIARWVRNAEAMAHVRVNDGLQDWARAVLSRNLRETIEIDNGPHSITRVRLRVFLLRDAKSSDLKKRDDALLVLKFAKEKGILMTLRHEPGELGELARKAFFEVMNPKVVSDRLPDAPSAQDTGRQVNINLLGR